MAKLMSFKRTWFKFKRQMKFHKAGDKVLLVLAILGIGATVYLILLFLPEASVERRASNAKEALEKDSFQRVMDEGTLRESIQFIETFDKKVDESLPVQVEHLSNKLNLAERIISLSDNDDESKEFGQLKQLEARLALERLFHANQQATRASYKQLEDQARRLIESDDKDVARLAHLANIYAMLVQISNDKQEPSEEEHQQLQDAVNELAEHFVGEAGVMMELFDYVKELRKLNRADIADALILAVANGFKDSPNPQIKNILLEFDKFKLRQKYQLSQSLRSVSEMQDNVREKNSQRITKLVDLIAANPKIESQYIELVNALMLLMQAGYPEDAAKFIEQSTQLFEQAKIPEIKKRRFTEIQKIIAHVGTEFSILPSLNSVLEPKPTLIILTSATAAQKGIVHMNKVCRMTRLMVADGSLDVVVVFMQNSDDERALVELRDRMAPHVGIKWHIANREQAEAFMREFPVSWLPTWVVADNQKKLVQVSPPLAILEKILIDLISPDS